MIENPMASLAPLFTVATFWFVVKLFYLIGFGIYIIFSLVVISQIRQMTRTIQGMLELPLTLLGWAHLALAVGALILAFVVL